MSNFDLMVAKGSMPGISSYDKFGLNPSVNTSLFCLCPQGGVLPYPSVATQLKVSSSSVNDTAGGTGQRSVNVIGLLADYSYNSEVVTLNGQTEVLTVGEYLRHSKTVGEDAGSSGINDGDIYVGDGVVTAGVPATIYTQMRAGRGRTEHCADTIAANSIGYIERIVGDVDSSKSVEVALFIRPFGKSWQQRMIWVTLGNKIDLPIDKKIIIPAKCDYELRATVDVGSAAISAALMGVVVNSDP